MCGIAGYIGKSKKPDLSFEIISRLFEKIESRGKDASGFWGVSQNNAITYYKEAIPASTFVVGKKWQDLKNKNNKVLLCHAREASKGVGGPKDNKNNHPFVNESQTVAAIHNGRIPDEIYNKLKLKYKAQSNCDSELFLKIFENDYEIDDGFWDRLNSIKCMWRILEGSHMAVALGEQTNESIRLWLFRNQYRSLWKIYVDELNQVFFASTKDIWESATSNLKLSGKPIELDVKKVYLIEIKNFILKQSAYEI